MNGVRPPNGGTIVGPFWNAIAKMPACAARSVLVASAPRQRPRPAISSRPGGRCVRSAYHARALDVLVSAHAFERFGGVFGPAGGDDVRWLEVDADTSIDPDAIEVGWMSADLFYSGLL